MSVDGIAAGQTLLGFRTCQPGLCLYYVWQAYKAHGAVADGTYPTAYSAWVASPGKRYDRKPPAGVPVYFGPKPGSAAGDVVISLGGGRVAATDWPWYGVIGSCTIDQRQQQIGRPYLGWTDNILGYPIALESTAGNGQPIQEEDMFTDADRAILRALNADRNGAGNVAVYERVEPGYPQEWMYTDPTLPQLQDDSTTPDDEGKQDGYRITQDKTLGRVWARQFSGEDKVPIHVSRAEYIDAQKFARERARNYRAAQVAIVRQALSEEAQA